MNNSIDDLKFLPPHEPTAIPGFHAYSNQMRVRPGETLELCISGEGPVTTQILRMGAATRDTTVTDTLPPITAGLQTIARGSHAPRNGKGRNAALFAVDPAMARDQSMVFSNSRTSCSARSRSQP